MWFGVALACVLCTLVALTVFVIALVSLVSPSGRRRWSSCCCS